MKYPSQAPDRPDDLLVGILGHLIRHALTGCGRAGNMASRLLEKLADREDIDRDLRDLCTRMDEHLESGHA